MVSDKPATINYRVGIKVATRIMTQWKMSDESMAKVLDVRPETLSDAFEPTDEQLDRVSYLLNIHAGLRILFSNPQNNYAFMNGTNDNAPLNGRKPIDLLASGDLKELAMLANHITSLTHSPL